jgi:polysaccharide deacetylase 2 family uncharacterized protein YibQ
MSRFADLLKARVAKICIILDDMGNNATLVDAEMIMAQNSQMTSWIRR